MDTDLKILFWSLNSGMLALISVAFGYMEVAYASLAVMFILLMTSMAVSTFKKP